MDQYVCLHAHFYQPPRENPWLEEVEVQDSAYPYHDWNEKITNECYGPNTASRILDGEGRIVECVNNFSKISFNIGPTLFSWLERHAPDVYESILRADRESQRNFSGHGSALAQAYSHLILPLATSRDKCTQVLWGLKDFEHRFGREPEGMWLPETAVDLETLSLLAEHGIKFTVLAQHQARRVRALVGGEWVDVSGGRVDPRMPYLCRLPTGETICIFFYDGSIASEVSFGELLSSGEAFARRLLDAFSRDSRPQLVSVAVDGETYGHHRTFGDMGLAYCLRRLETEAKITIFGEYLERNLPTHEVEIYENSSWGCVHGVERWKEDCGCNTGMHPGWNQAWRRPLREGMEWLRDSLLPIFERGLAAYLKDPWQARDEYIGVILDRSEGNVKAFLKRHSTRDLREAEKVRVLKLLEMQRHAMLMFTSCGWFFDDVSRIESVQVIKHAAHAMQLAKEVAGVDLEPKFTEYLGRARSNVSDFGSAAEAYDTIVKPAVLDLLRVGAHYAVSCLFWKYPEIARVYCYTVKRKLLEHTKAKELKLVLGKIIVRSDITWEKGTFDFAVLRLNAGRVLGGIRLHRGENRFQNMREELMQTFRKGDVSELSRIVERHFKYPLSLWHLFRDERDLVLRELTGETLRGIGELLLRASERYPGEEAWGLLPGSLVPLAEFVLNLKLVECLQMSEVDLNNLRKLIGVMKRGGLKVDRVALGLVASRRVDELMGELQRSPGDLQTIERNLALMKVLSELDLELNLWRAQKICYQLAREKHARMRELAKQGEGNAKRWLEDFEDLAKHLRVKV